MMLSTKTEPFSSSERSEMFEIMRDAYARTELEIWGENYVRMPQTEYENLIDDGKIIAATLNGRIVGTIYSYQLDQETSSFGLLGVHRDFEGRGIGRKLIEAVEEKAQLQGSNYMNIEILRPRDFKVPLKDRLRAWYEGMGYVFTHDQNFQERRPIRAKDLKVPSVFDCYQKRLG